MNNLVDSIAQALVLGAMIGALAVALGLVLDHRGAPARDRVWIWRLAMFLPLLPPVATALLSLTPEPVLARVVVALPAAAAALAPTPASATPVQFDMNLAAEWLLIAAALAAFAAAVRLAGRTRRLARIRSRSSTSGTLLAARADTAARRAGVTAPRVRLSEDVSEAMLTGVLRPMLLLPQAWEEMPPAAIDLVLAHEMAHLQRRDHQFLWLDEALAVLLALNPLTHLAHARLRTTREEACDALALAGCSTTERRDFARAYIEALQSQTAPLPALSFAGESRRLAMRRLNEILSPRPAFRRGAIAAAVTASALVAASAAAAWSAADIQPPSSEPPSLEEAERVARQYMGDEAFEAQTRAFAVATGADFQRFCASGVPGEDGYCAGVIIGAMLAEAQAPDPRFCAPEPEHAAISRAKDAVARVEAASTEAPQDVALRALVSAYPCGSGTRPAAPANELAQTLVNGVPLPTLPEGYGPVQITAIEIVRHHDGSVDWRSPDGRPVTGFAIDGIVQPAGFDLRTVDPASVARLQIDAGTGYIDVILKAKG